MIGSDKNKTIIETKNLVKTYIDKGVETRVLRGINMSVKKGEFVAIMGRSGAGKSTLLYQMSLLDNPTTGEIIIDGEGLAEISDEERADFRLNRLGYVFQDYALIPELSASENLMAPLLMQGYSFSDSAEKAKKVLTRIGLGERLNNLPSGLSGGEQQRVGVARAIVHKPDILFADEPTANLDTYSAKTVLDLFVELNREGQTIVMVTHEEEYGALADRIITLLDGQIVP